MSNLTHLFKPGQKVRWKTEGKTYGGTVTKTYEDHIIVDVPQISDHCWFEQNLNLDELYPEYNF